MEEGIVTISKKELTRLEVVQRVTGRQMRHAEAARQLSLSERHFVRPEHAEGSCFDWLNTSGAIRYFAADQR